MFDNSINTPPLCPGKHLHNGDIFNPQSPSHHLLAFIKGQIAQPSVQVAYLNNVDLTTRADELWHYSNAQPAVEHFSSYIRLQFHDGFLLAFTSVVFDKTSLGYNQGARIDAEDLFIWKGSNKAVSNA